MTGVRDSFFQFKINFKAIKAITLNHYQGIRKSQSCLMNWVDMLIWWWQKVPKTKAFRHFYMTLFKEMHQTEEILTFCWVGCVRRKRWLDDGSGYPDSAAN